MNEDSVLRTFIPLVQTAHVILKYADTHLYRKLRLSVVRFMVLQALASGAMMPSKIAHWTQTERQNITALVDRMKRDGLVSAERNNKDRRLVSITLTDKGREVLSQAMPVAGEIVTALPSIKGVVANLVESGLSYAEIGRWFGITRERVRQIAKPKPKPKPKKPDLTSDSMLTTSGAARLLGVHMNTVRRWSNKGIIRAYRIGPRGDRRFRREDIDNFLKELR